MNREGRGSSREGSSALAGQQEELHEENGDEDETADEVMGLEAEDPLFAGWVGRRDVAVLVIMHADKHSDKWRHVRWRPIEHHLKGAMLGGLCD